MKLKPEKMMKPSTNFEIVCVLLIAVVGLFVLTSCQSGGVVPRTESGSVDWEEVDRIRQGIEDVRRPDPVATAESVPDPDEGEQDDQDGQDDDEFPEGLIWLGPDASGWEVVTDLDVTVAGGEVRLDHNATFPVGGMVARDGGRLAGNPWVIAEVKGQWYAATWEWLRPGQKVKAASSVNGAHVKRREFSPDWKPASGQRIGFMVSSDARGPHRTSDIRSKVDWVVWP
jgi:hypothetical protein